MKMNANDKLQEEMKMNANAGIKLQAQGKP